MTSELKFDNKQNLILLEDEDRTLYIPAKHVYTAYRRMQEGVPYNLASPMYYLSRREAAFILAEYANDLPMS